MLVCVILGGEEGVVCALHSKPLSSYLTVSITGTDLETSQLHHYERDGASERETHAEQERGRDWREGLHHILLMHRHWRWGVMHEPQREKESLEKYSEQKTVTEREHEGLYGGKCEVP